MTAEKLPSPLTDPALETGWRTKDGLRCAAAIYRGSPVQDAESGSSTRPPIVCLHGLTRNSADFEGVARILTGRGHTVYALTFRGRGQSDWDRNYRNYHPAQYRDDVLAALDAFDIERAAFIGTSLGGIVTMLIAATKPDRIECAVINDVGPQLAPEGLARIGALLADRTDTNGHAKPMTPETSFDAALATIKRHNVPAFPDADETFWRAFTKRTHRQQEDGVWTPDYDSGIARALVELGAGDDLQPAFESLAQKPLMLIRGAISDLMTDDIAHAMKKSAPHLVDISIPRIGHAPMLDEPESIAALTDFLDKAAAEGV
ncbi:MAG: alpha/beta hydrolase [Pseudomonadota bacterium]